MNLHKQNVFRICATLCILMLLTSCAYRFGATRRSLPGGYNRLSVPIFKNRSFETGIESFFTNAMIEELERNKYAEITSGDDAQVTLEGTIVSVTYTRGATQEILPTRRNGTAPASGTGVQLATEYRIVISTSLSLIRRSDQKVLWSGTFNKEKQYNAPKITTENLNSANAIYNHSARIQNIATMAKDMMAEAHSQLTENF